MALQLQGGDEGERKGGGGEGGGRGEEGGRRAEVRAITKRELEKLLAEGAQACCWRTEVRRMRAKVIMARWREVQERRRSSRPLVARVIALRLAILALRFTLLSGAAPAGRQWPQ